MSCSSDDAQKEEPSQSTSTVEEAVVIDDTPPAPPTKEKILQDLGIYQRKGQGFHRFYSKTLSANNLMMEPTIIEYEEGYAELNYYFERVGDKPLHYKGIQKVSIDADGVIIYSTSVSHSTKELENLKWVEATSITFEGAGAKKAAENLIKMSEARKLTINIQDKDYIYSSTITKPMKDEYKKIGEVFLEHFEV